MPRVEKRYDEVIEGLDNAVADAEQEIIDRGFLPPTRPKNSEGELDTRPVMPPNLDDCTMDELQYLLGQFTEWYTYAGRQSAEAENQLDKCKEKKTFSWAKIRGSIQAGTVSDKDDETRRDQRYTDVIEEMTHWSSMMRWMKVITDSLLREIETISRAVTMMEQRMGVEGRSYRAGRRVERVQQGERRRDALSRFQGNRRGR